MSHDNHGGTKKIWIVFWILLALTTVEVVLGIFWAWLPILGIHEVPSTNTLIGGCAIVMAIILQGINARKIHVIPMP